jgi:hypothetical protein
MDGWRDVDVGSARRTGGGRRRDKESVQEIIVRHGEVKYSEVGFKNNNSAATFIGIVSGLFLNSYN